MKVSDNYPLFLETVNKLIKDGKEDKAYAALLKLNDIDYVNIIRMPEAKELKIAKTYLHTHTDLGSPKDSVLTVGKYVHHAKATHTSSITVTDHGTMYAVQPLYNACTANGIKLIIGCEFYVCDDADDNSVRNHTRLHLIAYAKNKAGYDAVSTLVTEGNKHIINVGALAFPCISKSLLQQYVGEGSKGHGNVILTSACIGGVLAGICYANKTNEKNLVAAEEKANRLQECFSSFSTLSGQIAKLMSALPEHEKIAARKFTKREVLGTDKEQLEKDKKETAEMTAQVKAEKAQIRALNRTRNKLQSDIDDVISNVEGTQVAYASDEQIRAAIQKMNRQIDDIKKSIIETDFDSYFEKEMLWYDNLAGHGNWFIEIQNHGIPEEKLYMPKLFKLAVKHNIPFVAANDAHMEIASDLLTRKAVNSLRFNTWEEPQVGDSELYLKTDPELYAAIAEIIPSAAAAQAMHNRLMITEACNVELKKEPHYPKFVV